MRIMYIPNKGGLRDLILEEMHNVPYSVHPDLNKMDADVKPLYFC